MTLQQHIDFLTYDMGVAVVPIDNPIRARANSTLRVAEIAPVGGDENAYWIALHELGHIATDKEWRREWVPKQPGGPLPDAVMDFEARAWQWAIDNSIKETTPQVKALIYGGLTSHKRSVGEIPPRYAALREWAADGYDQNALDRLTALAESAGKRKVAEALAS